MAIFDNLSRRAFLIGASSAAGVTMGYAILPANISAVQAAGASKFSPSMFFDIGADGKVMIHITKAEMGQHVGTALAQILADELEVAWGDVSISHVGFDPKYGLTLTGGSWSVNWTFDTMSRAGAAGRIVLVEAAAEKWGVDPLHVTARESVVSGPNGKRISYGELISQGIKAREFSEEEMKGIKLKSPEQRRYVGTDVPAIDIPAKTRGQAKYGIDVTIDGMVYATPAPPPVRYGATVKSVDDSQAKRIDGYQRYVIVEDPVGTQTGFVMAIADSYWKANKASKVLKIEYDLGPNATVSTKDIEAVSAKLVSTKEGSRLVLDDGDVDGAIQAAESLHEATYTTSMAVHVPLEPMNAVVEVKDGIYHIHAGSQFQTLLMGLVQEALGIKAEEIVFHQHYLGGGFGRRLEADYIVMACLTAREVGRPVKMIYSREVDTAFDFPRTPTVVRLRAGIIKDKIDCWESASASAWAVTRMAPAFQAPDLSGDEKNVYDPFSINGADHWYSVPNQRVLLSLNEIAQSAIPPGHLRSVSAGWQWWAVESFVDELAHKLGKDPLALRLEMLDGTGKNAGEGATTGGAKRLATVLRLVAERAGYGKSLPKNTAIGLAAVASQERPSASWTATAANVTVDPVSGSFTVNKLTVGTDVGAAINPRAVEAQVAGASMWGLSLATLEEATLENGAIQQSNFDAYTPARMSDAPELDIFVVNTPENYPTGCGEPATTSVAPAIANAIFAASGARVRSLPIRPGMVKEVMAG